MKLLGAGGKPKPKAITPLPVRPSAPLPASALAVSVRALDPARQRRLSNALRMDNRGVWYRCASHWTVEQLERRFAEELAASVLYERIGGLLQADEGHVYVQIALVKSVTQKMHPDSEPERVEVPTEKPTSSVVTALRELRVELGERVDDIRSVLASGKF